MRFPRQPVGAFLLLISCLCLELPPARGLDAKTNPSAAQNVEQGKAQFEKSCAVCHGAEATGGMGPDLLESTLVRHDVNGNLIAPVIEGGRPGKGMPAFPMLSSAEIADIVAFLHARIEAYSKVSSLEAVPGGYSMKQLLTGNAAAGKRFFYGAGKCSTCHSPTGDLAGVANKYSPMDLTSEFLYPSNDSQTATVTLASGRQVKGKLLHLDAFYVAIRDQGGEYRSWPLSIVKVKVTDPLAEHRQLLKSYTDKDIHNVLAYLETLK